jgi:hypothetical protein
VDIFKQQLCSIDVKVKYSKALQKRHWEESKNIGRKAFQDADAIQEKAMYKIKKLIGKANALATNAGNPVEVATRLESIVKEIEAIKANAIKDIDHVVTKFDQDIEAIAVKFDTLMEAAKK